MRKYLPIVLIFVLLVGLGVWGLGIFAEPIELAAAHEPNLAGWAWSFNIGWISFNCADRGTCGVSDYGVNLNEVSGELSGFAWANPRDGGAGTNNIGWISFNAADVLSCPIGGDCQPRLNPATNQLEGWARAIRGADRNGGWAGWISLNCSNADTCATSDYYVEYNPATKKFGDFANNHRGDFAWGGRDSNDGGAGSEVIGWIDWDPNCNGSDADCGGVHLITDYELTVTKPGLGQGTVTSVNDGDEDNDGQQDINCGSDCFEDYNGPTTVELNSTSEPGSVFVGWTVLDENGNPTGECANPASNCVVTVDQQKTVQANFRKAACNNGDDDDGDGFTDLADLGCADVNDDNEENAPPPPPPPPDDGCPGGVDCPRCNDGIDNDDDGQIDYAGCYGVYDAVLETNVCTGNPNDAWFEPDSFCRGNPEGGRESFNNDVYEI